MSLTAALEELEQPEPQFCTVGTYLEAQSPADKAKIRALLAGGTSRNRLFAALKKGGLPVKNVSSLNNHLSGRCGCADVDPTWTGAAA